MASFIYKHSERNSEEYIEYPKRKISQNDIQGSSNTLIDAPHGIQIESMNPRRISDRSYPFDHTPNITLRDLNKLFESNR